MLEDVPKSRKIGKASERVPERKENMDRLPQEIINLVASFIERYPGQEPGVLLWQARKVSQAKLPPYASITESWKHAIERTVF